MTEKGAKRGEEASIWKQNPTRQRYGCCAFEHVAKESRGCEFLIAGAQNVGGADIAGTDRAQVLRAREPRQDDAKWNGATQIAKAEGAAGISEKRRPRERYRYCHKDLPSLHRAKRLSAG